MIPAATIDLALLTRIALVAISGLVAGVFAVAWAALGRPRYALNWASAFVIATAAWIIELLPGAGEARSAAVLSLQGFAVTLVALGFRRRSGRFVRNRWLLTLAGLAALATVSLHAVAAGSLSAAPFALLSAFMFCLAAGALTGRRRNERGAERIAMAVLNLLAAGHAFALAMMLAAAAGRPIHSPIPPAAWLMLLPAMVTTVGLFTIFLMTADLADRMRRLAGLDMPTGLLNRRGLDEAGAAMIGSMRRTGRAMTLMLVDIDHFKTINDRFGHPAGDRLIGEFARVLHRHTQRRDLLARVGGEEFAVVMADADADIALAAAETLRRAVAAQRFTLPEPFAVTASFGLAQLRPEDEGLAPALVRADAALYRSKAEGRNRATPAT